LGGLEETESTSCYTLATSPSQLIKNVRWEDAGTTGLGRLSPGRLMFIRLLHFTLNTIAACSWSSPKHGSPTVHCSKNHSIQPLIATRWSSIHKLIYRLICLLITNRQPTDKRFPQHYQHCLTIFLEVRLKFALLSVCAHSKFRKRQAISETLMSQQLNLDNISQLLEIPAS
jgi:hypothetical protein